MSSIADLKAQLALLQSLIEESDDDAAIAIYTTKIASIKCAIAELVSNSPMEIAPKAVPQTPLLKEKQVQLAKAKEPEKPMFPGTSQNEVPTVISLPQTSAKVNLNNDEVISPAKGKLSPSACHFNTIFLIVKQLNACICNICVLPGSK